MERAIDNGLPKAAFKVRISLDQLQMIAKRVEHALKVAKTGQEVTYDLTPSITLEFESLKTESMNELEIPASCSTGMDCVARGGIC